MPSSQSAVAASFDDPRITDRFCRRIDDDRGTVTLIGVVHDHPASIERVRRVLSTHPPDVLALEIPPAAVAIFRQNATRDIRADRFGGEMTTAIRTVPSATVIGIDAPSIAFCRHLLTRMRVDRPAPRTVKRILKSLYRASVTALQCRVDAWVSTRTSRSTTPVESIEYQCSLDDPPATQAAHERAHVAAVRALTAGDAGEFDSEPESTARDGSASGSTVTADSNSSATRTGSSDASTPPSPSDAHPAGVTTGDRSARQYRDMARERCMIEAIDANRACGSMAVVVGIDHLDTIERAIEANGNACS